MAKYEMKYMFDWDSGICVWSTNGATHEEYGYAIEVDALPISQELKNILDGLIEKHDTALNWNCPQGGLLWSDEEIDSFKAEATNAYRRLCSELGPDYLVEIWKNCLI